MSAPKPYDAKQLAEIRKRIERERVRKPTPGSDVWVWVCLAEGLLATVDELQDVINTARDEVFERDWRHD